ncbi:threonine/serine dehydratase [Streptomyces olivaceoviridis]|uniref:threonine ammonia-lyase n=1 Tax=Streptomyces olivaceoviridis TaxID=1921 RepID=UPI0036784021
MDSLHLAGEFEPDEIYLKRHKSAIDSAMATVTPHIRENPMFRHSSGVWLKNESVQPSGSFKIRGAFNALTALRESGVQGVVATSSGNHARAIAYAGNRLGIKALVVIPQDAVASKIAAVRRLGAEVVTSGVTFVNRDRIACELAEERAWPLVHSSDNWDVIHGQGSVAAEILEQEPQVDAIVVPVGGGGLISGTTLALKSRNPSALVIGVEPACASDAAISLRTGYRHRLSKVPATIADGARMVTIGERPFEVIVSRHLVDEIVTVTEDEILASWRAACEELKTAVEPTGALSLAALLAGKIPYITQRESAFVITGGNGSVA